MSSFALEIWNEGSACTLYTVRDEIDDSEADSETDGFFLKYGEEQSRFQSDAMKLNSFLLKDLSNRYGAIDCFFNRFENNATALPPKKSKDFERLEECTIFGNNFPLRLFCYRISEKLVILFNGGEKTADSAQESALSFHFYNAQRYVAKVEKARQEGDIVVSKDGLRLLMHDGSEDLIIY